MGFRGRILVGLAVLALALAGVGCGDDDDGGDGGTSDGGSVSTDTGGGGDTTSAPTDEIVDAKTLENCIKQSGASTGEPGSDAALAALSDQAVKAGGDTFVVENPISHVIVFPEPVDLAAVKSELSRVIARAAHRVTGLQADSFGNVLIVYFAPGGAEKTTINDCLGADAEPVPGFSVPFQPTDLAPEVPQ
jgi:hypothetical protein